MLENVVFLCMGILTPVSYTHLDVYKRQVVTQFSRMKVATAYRAQTMATLIQGMSGMLAVWLLSLVLL